MLAVLREHLKKTLFAHVTVMMQSAPTLTELRRSAASQCTRTSLAQLMGLPAENTNQNVIIVNKKDKQSRRRAGIDPEAAEYAQQYHRNCFYQFRDLHDTKESFFGITDDEHDATSPQSAAENNH